MLGKDNIVLKVVAATIQSIGSRKEKHHSSDLKSKGFDPVVVWYMAGCWKGQRHHNAIRDPAPLSLSLSAVHSVLDKVAAAPPGPVSTSTADGGGMGTRVSGRPAESVRFSQEHQSFPRTNFIFLSSLDEI